ncbi:hypothetical protein GIX45_26260 [Erwinia sp. CPCC 100877]|nr:hypothetical protein [Erwinia sp. CPCC 100877]
MAKKKYVLIKNKYRNDYSLYFDLDRNIFVEHSESSSVAIYILSVFAMVVMRGIEDSTLTFPFFYLIVIAVVIGSLLGFLFQIVDQYFKRSSKSFRTIDNSTDNLTDYLSEGKALLANQRKFIVATFVLNIIICISLYSNRTVINFLGVVIGTFLLVSLLNFASLLKKRKIFNSINQQLEK